MNLRKWRRKQEAQRMRALRRFERHRRANLLARNGVHRYIIVLDHLKPLFNIGKIFRSADTFGAHEVHLIGIDTFDPAPAMGSFKWVPARFHQSFNACYQDLAQRGYTLFTLEPENGSPLPETRLPHKSAFILGHEEFGHSFDPGDYNDIRSLRIPNLGRAQSLNVSVAASIVMYEYLRQHDDSFGSGNNKDTLEIMEAR